MIYESLIGKIVSSKENNSRNIFKNILKEKNENYFIMSNSKKKREFKLIKNVINNSKDNDKNLTNNKYEQKKTK
jgi:ferredoxin-fold anticodon binding domain-containing protein